MIPPLCHPYNRGMRLSEHSNFFQAVNEGARRFGSLYETPVEKGLRVAKPLAAALGGFGGNQALQIGKDKQVEKKLKKFVKKEVAKQVKKRQPAGLNFDLFG